MAPKTLKFKKQLGYILESGFSVIDGHPYVAIMTMNSTNRKTGNMAQVTILRSDIHPLDAIATGGDSSVCGNCKHRGHFSYVDLKWVGRSCYVNVGQGPSTIYKAFKNGKYKMHWTEDEMRQALKGRRIRWGSYGDPGILLPKMVARLNSYADGHTGYTHQWRTEWGSSFKGVFQASCDGLEDYLEATNKGWHCFSVAPKGGQAQGKLCPATAANSIAQCITCKLCDGGKVDIYVEAHGKGAKYVTT